MTTALTQTAGPRSLQIDWPLLIISAIGLLLRLTWLFQPMRYDEATTFLDIAQGGFHAILTQYGPNNHVLHTLLVHACTLWTSQPWAIRLPAFVAGVMMIPLTAVAGRQLFGRPAGLWGAALVACSGHLIEYSTNARGYSMVADFTLLQVVLADRIIGSAGHRDLLAFAVVTALGFFTIPTMLYPTAATLTWAALEIAARRRLVRWRVLLVRGAMYAGLCGGLIVLLYAPVLLQPDGMHNLFANRWIAPIESGWGRAAVRVGGEVIREWSLGLTIPGLVAVSGFALVGITRGVRRGDPRATWLIVAAVVCIAVMAAQRVVPFARVFSFALPMLLLTAGSGAAEVISAIAPARAAAAAAALCGGLALYVMLGRVPERSSTFDKFPAAASIVRFLTPRVADGAAAVVFGVVPSATVRYACLRAHRPLFTYAAGARRLLLVTREDESVEHVMASKRLRVADFSRPRLMLQKGIAEVYEMLPRAGRTPRQHRLPATLP